MKNQPKTLLSLADAAHLVGLGGKEPGRRLREYVQDKERRERRRILIRRGSTRMPRYSVTLTRLRRHCPELFDEPGEAERVIKQYMREHQQKHVELEEQVDELQQRVAGIEQAVIAELGCS